MSKLILIAGAAVLLAACARSDAVSPRGREMQPEPAMFSTRPTAATAAHAAQRAPDTAAAVANEEAILNQITAYVPAYVAATLVPTLRSSRSIITQTADPKLSSLIQQYYAARHTTRLERIRQASVDQAHERGGIRVVIAFGSPPAGTVASVLRRRTTSPTDVIVLKSDATAETLAGALTLLDRSRSLHGDNLLADEVIGIRQTRATDEAPQYLAKLQGILNELRHAPERSIAGVGVVAALDIKTPPLPIGEESGQ